MMYNYPFFSFPHFGRYANYYPTRYSVVKQPVRAISATKISPKEVTRKEPKVTPKEKSSPKRAPAGFSFLNNFGLKLYHDDILLIGLIFFLYKEEVKDQYLFFALVLLLLS